MILNALVERARRTPDLAAVSYDGQVFSYAWLAGQILEARRALQPLARHAGRVAAIHLDLLDNWIVSLALRSLGLTTLAVPVLDFLPSFRALDFACMLTSAEQVPVLEGMETFRVPADWRVSNPLGPSSLDLPGDAPTGGHILMSSGTTGRFKAFPVSAAADAINVASHIEIGTLTEDARMLVCEYGLWTSAGYYVTASTWAAGGCAVIERGPRWLHALALPEITDALLTPYVLKRQLAACGEALRPRDSLRLIVGGHALSWPVAEHALARATPRLFGLIASTETGFWSVSPVREPADVVWHQPHPSRRVEVVDGNDARVPAGVVGRVRIGVIDGASGYLADEASVASFRDGWFYPGDMGEMSADGRIALRGRESEVIPIGGVKLPAGHFEQALRERLGIDELCVLSAPNALGEEEIHVALETNQPLAHQQMIDAARAVFPEAGPVRFHFVDALPRTSFGKVQRFALKQQLTARP